MKKRLKKKLNKSQEPVVWPSLAEPEAKQKPLNKNKKASTASSVAAESAVVQAEVAGGKKAKKVKKRSPEGRKDVPAPPMKKKRKGKDVEPEQTAPPKAKKRKKDSPADGESAVEAPSASAKKQHAADESWTSSRAPGWSDGGGGGGGGSWADAKNERKIFVGGIAFSADEAHLRSLFEQCGVIEDFVFMRDENGSFKGVAFITFATKEAVPQALEYDGDNYRGRELKVAMATVREKDSKGAGGKGKDKGKGKGKDKGKGKGKDKGSGDKGKGKGKDKGKDKGKGKDVGKKGSDKGGGKPPVKKFGFEMSSGEE